MSKRSMPDGAASAPSSKKRIQKFRKEYTDEFPYILPARHCEYSAFCEICCSQFTVKYAGKYDITRHIASATHTSLAKQVKVSKSIETFFPTSKAKKNTDVIKAEVMLVDLVTELNLPLATLDKFTKAFKLMFKDDIAKDFQCGRSKGTAIVKEIAAKTTLSLAERMKMYPFTISTDGSNDCGSCKLFPIVVRTVDPNTKLVNSDLLSIPVCEGSATGENIFNLLHAEISAHKIPWTNCLSFGADNAPVMVGKDKGVLGYMAKQHSNIFMSGSACHLVHIAAEKAASCLPLSIDQLLIDVYYYLDTSSKRQGAFKDMQLLHEVKQNKILKHVCTRWLSIKKCLPRVLDNWEPLLAFFKNEEKLSTPASKERASNLRKKFSSPTNRLICLFLNDALQPFDEFNTYFQSEEPKIHLLQSKLQILVKSLLIRYMKPSALLGVRVTEVDNLNKANLKDNEDLHLGQAASDFMERKNEVHLREEKLNLFYDGVKAFFNAAVEYLKVKLPLNEELLRHMEVDVFKQTSSSSASLDYFLKRYPVLLPKNVSASDLKLEFSLYQATDIQSCMKERLDSTWAAIGKINDNGRLFKNLAEVMLALLTIPHSSAHCERIFSLVRRNRTEFRSRLNNETIEALLICKSRPGDAINRVYSDSELEDLKSAYYKSLQASHSGKD
ncbi:hypothetical protein Bpfe_019928 [Biomphalaria pfeifferi]|uniref:HAT C-terminal dimerisation domain-containing protein n=1 Tax=Biomphalaria pfeifferi TaxID=112525 RepID=A0AAD8B9V5_BIOPF|nr:hypothetical protein Bpfe_019928 [Biomphalaria pfeifferi]